MIRIRPEVRSRVEIRHWYREIDIRADLHHARDILHRRGYVVGEQSLTMCGRYLEITYHRQLRIINTYIAAVRASAFGEMKTVFLGICNSVVCSPIVDIQFSVALPFRANGRVVVIKSRFRIA